MIGARRIWCIIRGHASKKKWVSSKEIYDIVEQYGNLDSKDRLPQSPFSKTPQWKILVRNVLVNRLKKGKIRWREKTGEANDPVG